MREIKLTRGKIALVDDEDFEQVATYAWCVLWNKNKNKCYARRRACGDKKILMHREILNAPAGKQVDHVNGNTLDNRKKNLRTCTSQQNNFNRKEPQRNNKLRIKGVGWHKKAMKFHARIMINGRVVYLGYYNILGDADSAYRIAEEKYFGEFARNNL